MTQYDTRKEAEGACHGNEPIVRVCVGWLVMTWQEQHVWELQK